MRLGVIDVARDGPVVELVQEAMQGRVPRTDGRGLVVSGTPQSALSMT